MKRIILVLFIVLVFPCIINASCNNVLHEKLKDEASNITQTINYNVDTNKFRVLYYNVSEGIYAKYNNKRYNQKDNIIEINNLSEGTELTIIFYTDTGCNNEIDIRRVSIPYKNVYYGTALCSGYEDKLTMCSEEFLGRKVTKELILEAIDNEKNNTIPVYVPPEKEKVVEKSIIDKTIDFAKKWGLKIGLSVTSGLITFVIGSILYRKELHGV